jgi:hypothetical protein
VGEGIRGGEFLDGINGINDRKRGRKNLGQD